MAETTDPFPADRAGIGAQADVLGTGMRLRVAMSTRECAGRVVVALSGDVDVTDADGVAALIATVAARVPWLIVDLTGLTFIDCAGTRALAAVARHARQAGGGLVLAAPAPLVRWMLGLTGLMTDVPVCATVGEAVGITSQRTAAPTVCGQDAQAHVAALLTVRPKRRQEEGQRDPDQQPTMADTRPDSS